ncbi:hypothetical protein AYO40_03575 [Planctomycetaceae bacterium SCGC AG-212-D15]|nr:hypothetical protein AYO40_03575 [Planctomycetaceae bacterium SCGC AG-212-D15]
MDRCSQSCQECVSSIVCRCLQVTEETVIQAISRLALTTVSEVRDYTGAGGGCNCCHTRIRNYLAEHGYAAETAECSTL